MRTSVRFTVSATVFGGDSRPQERAGATAAALSAPSATATRLAMPSWLKHLPTRSRRATEVGALLHQPGPLLLHYRCARHPDGVARRGARRCSPCPLWAACGQLCRETTTASLWGLTVTGVIPTTPVICGQRMFLARNPVSRFGSPKQVTEPASWRMPFTQGSNPLIGRRSAPCMQPACIVDIELGYFAWLATQDASPFLNGGAAN